MLIRPSLEDGTGQLGCAVRPPRRNRWAGMISSFVRALISAFKARRELALENVALRQQLAVVVSKNTNALPSP